ncbi:MAG TPA: hypothetical protein VIK14_06645 [Ignavibacteria bacterium]
MKKITIVAIIVMDCILLDGQVKKKEIFVDDLYVTYKPLNDSLRHKKSLEGQVFSQKKSNKKSFRLNLSFTAGKFTGGPSYSLERAMVNSGFNQTFYGNWFTQRIQNYPWTEKTLFPGSWSIEINGSVYNNLGAGICFNGTEITETFGNAGRTNS